MTTECQRSIPISNAREQLRDRAFLKFKELTAPVTELAQLANDYDAALMRSLVYRSRNSEIEVEIAAAALMSFLDHGVAQ